MNQDFELNDYERYEDKYNYELDDYEDHEEVVKNGENILDGKDVSGWIYICTLKKYAQNI